MNSQILFLGNNDTSKRNLAPTLDDVDDDIIFVGVTEEPKKEQIAEDNGKLTYFFL